MNRRRFVQVSATFAAGAVGPVVMVPEIRGFLEDVR